MLYLSKISPDWLAYLKKLLDSKSYHTPKSIEDYRFNLLIQDLINKLGDNWSLTHISHNVKNPTQLFIFWKNFIKKNTFHIIYIYTLKLMQLYLWMMKFNKFRISIIWCRYNFHCVSITHITCLQRKAF